jgi:hypothetical protein
MRPDLACAQPGALDHGEQPAADDVPVGVARTCGSAPIPGLGYLWRGVGIGRREATEEAGRWAS